MKTFNAETDKGLSSIRILVACEESGVVTNAFRKKGFNAMSCDVMETSGSENHYRGDIFDLLHLKWDVIIGFPPCTYLTVSGARWLYNKDGSKNLERWENLRKGAEFFKALWEAPATIGKALENPIMMGHARKIIWGFDRKADQIIQPYHFGHTESKATGLYLDRLPKLEHTSKKEDFDIIYQRIWKLPPSADRAKLRSKTFSGIADAMAEHWGNYIVQHLRSTEELS